MSAAATFSLDHMATPIGRMLIVTDEQQRLRALDWEDYDSRMHRLLRLHYGNAVALEKERAPGSIREPIEAYLDGDCAAIDAIPVATAGTTFQRRVWAQLRRIPPGAPTSYGKLAIAIGRPEAIRAVGAANGANPVGVVVPCHRVIGADGSLTGFGGGLHRKRWLLAHESKFRAQLSE